MERMAHSALRPRYERLRGMIEAAGLERTARGTVSVLFEPADFARFDLALHCNARG